jgi:AAA ATPase containing von Willebrand factor type A (vWA) domain
MATPAVATPGPPAGAAGSTNRNGAGHFNKNVNQNSRKSFPHPSGYTILKGGFEGGDKRMLDVIFERLKYTVRAEWTEGQTVSKILDSFEDVEIEEPALLSAAEREDELLVTKWKEKVKRHVGREENLEAGKVKLYSTIWKLLSDGMKNKLAGSDGFEAKNEASDVVWLVNKVRALVTDFDSNKPEIQSVRRALERILTYRQGERVDNADYVKNLMALIKVYEQYCGPYGVHLVEIKRIEDKLETAVDEAGDPLSDRVKAVRKKALIRAFREKAIAMQIIEGACTKRYSAFKRTLSLHYGVENDLYPETVDKAINALNVAESELPNRYKKGKREDGYTFAQVEDGDLVPGTNGKTVEHITCHKCKKMGHYANKCPSDQGEEGATNPTSEQVSTHVLCQSHQTVGEQSMNHIQLTTSSATLDKAWILLDSESTVHVFNNKELLSEVRRHPEGKTLRVHTNGGVMDSDMVGRFGDIDVWYNPNSIANILSLALIVDTYRVTLDSRIEHAFTLWLEDNAYIKFHKRHRLFVYNSTSDPVTISPKREAALKTTDVSLLQTVSENERMYRRRDVEMAKAAMNVSKLLFHPAQSKFEKIVSGNFVTNLPISLADVRRSEKIYGPAVPSIKGRTTRRQPEAVQDLVPVGIPREMYNEYKHTTLCLDFFYVNKLIVMHAISRKLQHRWVCFPESRSMKHMKKNFDMLRRVYHSRGFRVVTVHADEEFEKIRNHMLPSRLITPNPGGHVPEVERSIRTLKEGCRAAIHGMPYSVYPKEMLRGLIRKVVLMTNAVPSESGVSDTLSPRNLIENLPHLDYHSIKIAFGSYVQVAVDEQITITPRPRTIGCIVLDPTGTNQKYRLMSLESGKKVSGRIVRILPITDEVIDRVNELGTQQKQPRIQDGRLLFEWRPGVPVDGDVYMIDDGLEPIIEGRDDNEVIPEPLEDDAVDDHQDMDREADEANAVTDETDDSDQDGDDLDDESQRTEGENESEFPIDAPSTTSSEGDDASSSETSDGDDDEESVDESEDESVSTLDSESTTDQSQESDHENLPSDSEGSTHDEATAGRESRERVPNPKYFGDDYVNFQFLQSTFESLNEDARAQYLEYALDDYRMSGKTTLVERFLTGVILTQMSTRAGLVKHGKDAEKVLLKEFTQFKDMDVMEALDPDKLTPQQIKDALGMIGVIQEKRNHTPEAPKLKYRGCADGRKERGKYTKEETASPTNSLDAFMMTLMTDAMEGRDVAISDVVGAYLNAMMKEFVAMKVVGREAELMCELNPTWKRHLRYDRRGKAILYVRLKKALYGCVRSALLWYELYSSTLKDLGFEINPYDQCVANKMINGHMCTICWYVDDNKISHKDPAVVTQVIEAIEGKFGKMKVSRGKSHEFLGMKIVLRGDGTVSIDMKDYVKKAIDEFPVDIVKNAATPANRFLFEVREDVPDLDKERREIFHSTVARLLYICKRCRLDIQNAVAFLTTRVSRSDEDDWKKLIRVLQYLRGTLDDKLILGAIDIKKMKSFVDAAFAVHADMKSHTGGGISWGIGILLSMCQKQKLNSKSSTEAEVIGVSDFLPNIIWARMFLEQQGYDIDKNVLYQDNQSAMKIEMNGAKSCGRQSRHIDMRYFFIKDRLESENIKVIYCPTEHMVADFFTKPLQGRLFHYLKRIIMGQEPITTLTSQFWTEKQERVGEHGNGNPSVSFDLKTDKVNDERQAVQTEIEDEVRGDVRESHDVDNEKQTKSYADAVRGTGDKHCSLIDFYSKTKD